MREARGQQTRQNLNSVVERDTKALAILFKESLSQWIIACQRSLPGVPLPLAPIYRHRLAMFRAMLACIGIQKGIGRAIIDLAGTAAGQRGHRREEYHEIQRRS